MASSECPQHTLGPAEKQQFCWRFVSFSQNLSSSFSAAFCIFFLVSQFIACFFVLIVCLLCRHFLTKQKKKAYIYFVLLWLPFWPKPLPNFHYCHGLSLPLLLLSFRLASKWHHYHLDSCRTRAKPSAHPLGGLNYVPFGIQNYLHTTYYLTA